MPNMVQVFKDSKLQQQFEQDGFVRIPLLTEKDKQDLLDYFESYSGERLIENTDYGMYVSLDEENKDLKQDIINELRKILMPRLDEHLQNYKVHLGGYLVKQPEPQRYTFPHQDWTFVDINRPEDFSATIWISLFDLSPDTGSLGFIKGSHRFMKDPVGSPSPAVKTLTQGHEPALFQYLHFPECNAGDALMFNNKCVHAANPNAGDFPRLAVGIGVTPKEAPIHHYYLKPGTSDQLLKLAVEEDFFLEYTNDKLLKLYQQGEVPGSSKIIDEVYLDPARLSTEELLDMVVEAGNEPSGYKLEVPGMNDDSEATVLESVKEDNRSFFEIYTPGNIYREIKYRLTGK